MLPRPINAQRLLEFLEALGRCYRHSGRLYLVGGSSLLLVAAKESTLDIDLKFEVIPEFRAEFLRCLRLLSREMQIPVEQVSPEEFIPLPPGSRDRCQFLGRFGEIDVFHFDFYSIALSKLHRGNEKDFADILAMNQVGLIKFDVFARYFAEILPKLESYRLESDPDAFERKFGFLKNLLGIE